MFNAQCDDRLIKQIIEKGRFVNKIAQAIHKEQEIDEKYELPENLSTSYNGPGSTPPKMQHLVPLDIGL